MWSRRRAFLGLSCSIGLTLLWCGCSHRTPNYTPSVSVAEAAVRGALDAWKSGAAVGVLPDTQPPVHVVDVGRKPGQTLSNYRVLGETRGPSGRTFVVTLNLDNPHEDLKTQYIVVGIDPLWVFRQEDYELLAHWDHHMPATTKDAANPAKDQ